MSNVLSLAKTAKLSLEKQGFFEEGQFNVAFSLDISGSMHSLYKDGTVQELTERLLGLGMNLDSNKSIEIYLFGSKHYSIGEVSQDNIDGFVNREITGKYSLENSTNYAEVMKQIGQDFSNYNGGVTAASQSKGFLGGLFGRKKSQSDIVTNSSNENSADKEQGTIVFFITDGDNFDKSEARKVIRELSHHGIFWQFVGIGNSSFGFLEELDDMPNRYIDNANFFKVSNLKKTSDKDLYNLLVSEFPSWVKEARQKNLIK